MSQPKFCPVCGNALNENEKFCGKCGTPVAPAAAAPAPAPVPAPEPAPAPVPEAAPIPEAVPSNEPAPAYQPVPEAAGAAAASSPAAEAGKNIAAAIGRHKGVLIISFLAIAAIVAAIIVILNLTKYQKISAKDLFKVDFKGINGSGTAVAYLNAQEADPDPYTYQRDEDGNVIEKEYSKYFSDSSKELLKAYDKAGDKDEAKDMKDALLSKKKGEYKIKAKLDKDSGLTNGDKISVSVEFDEDELLEAKIKLENTEFEVEVEGLVEGTELDMFDGFEISFTGQNESGKIEYSDTNSKYDFISYYMSDGSAWDVKNGDTVVITANLRSGRLEGLQYLDPNDYTKGCYFTYNGTTYIVKEMDPKKTYTVEGLSEPQGVDVFKDIKFRSSGALPYLRITGVLTDDCDSVIKDNVSFSIDLGDKDYLKVGDTFKVKAYVYSGLKSAGYKPNVEPDADGYYVKEFTVDDSYGHYIAPGNYTEEDRTKLEAKLRDTIDKFKRDYLDRTSIGNVRLDGKSKSFGTDSYDTAYSVTKEGFADGTCTDSTKSYTYYVVKMPVTFEGEDGDGTKDIYLALKLSNALVNTEGEADFGSYIQMYVYGSKGEFYKDVVDKEEGTKAELKAGESGGNTPEPDESTPDESEPDESEPDESTPDESTPDESEQPADTSSEGEEEPAED